MGALTASALGGYAGLAHGGLSAAEHNKVIDRKALQNPEFQKKVDAKVIADGKRSIVGNALVSPFGYGGYSAYTHNRDRYDAAVSRSK